MEYIKKEELIIGEIYKSNKYNHIFKYQSINGNTNINISCNYRHFSRGCATIGQGLDNIINTTSEEKHWLNEVIRLDKFITFEEAMKTFIPEYAECTKEQHRSSYKVGIIYKLKNTLIENEIGGVAYWTYNQHRFKPSTKEAYDAQFVVKEEEFVLPEKWCLKITKENLDFCKSLENNELKFHKNYPYSIGGYYSPIPNKDCNGFINIPENYTEITFEQFKKYVLKEEIVEEKVIEPLPQFKVIESIETITKVENNEGNQFFIGDVVISSNGIIQTIESFDYNKAKTNIIAFTNKQSILGIGIDKIEHYIEPKTDYKILEYKTEGGISCKAPFLADSHQFYINERYKIYSIKRISDDLIITVGDEVLGKTCGVPNKILSIELINNKIRLYPRNSFYNLEDIIKVKDETLLEKAKRLYPIGTKFKAACNPKYIGTVKDHKDYPFQDVDIVNLNTIENIDGCTGMTVFYKGKWAEIINE